MYDSPQSVATSITTATVISNSYVLLCYISAIGSLKAMLLLLQLLLLLLLLLLLQTDAANAAATAVLWGHR